MEKIIGGGYISPTMERVIIYIHWCIKAEIFKGGISWSVWVTLNNHISFCKCRSQLKMCTGLGYLPSKTSMESNWFSDICPSNWEDIYCEEGLFFHFYENEKEFSAWFRKQFNKYVQLLVIHTPLRYTEDTFVNVKCKELMTGVFS